MSFFFTADQHYGHRNIIKYCNRPFESIEEMDETLIENHNEVVKDDGDIVYHVGDFALAPPYRVLYIIDRLNGKNIFIKGSHDRWMRKAEMGVFPYIVELKLEGGIHIVLCHYAMRVWPRSHYNSWQIFGHSHGGLEPVGKQWDVGVDNNNFYPVSLDQIVEIMAGRPDNFNLIRKGVK